MMSIGLWSAIADIRLVTGMGQQPVAKLPCHNPLIQPIAIFAVENSGWE